LKINFAPEKCFRSTDPEIVLVLGGLTLNDRATFTERVTHI